MPDHEMYPSSKTSTSSTVEDPCIESISRSVERGRKEREREREREGGEGERKRERGRERERERERDREG